MKYKLAVTACGLTKEDLDGQIEKIMEELEEFKKEHYTSIRYAKLKSLGFTEDDISTSMRMEALSRLVEEGVDILTAVATYFAKAGVTEAEVHNAVIMVEAKNRKRGYSL